MGAAGTGRDSDSLWQIGISVVDKYRNKKVALNLGFYPVWIDVYSNTMNR